MKKLITSCVALAMLLSFSGCGIKQSAESIPNSSGVTTSEASTDTIPETIAPDGIDESTEIDGVMSYEKNIETESEKKPINLKDTVYELIGAYADGENKIRVDISGWQVSEDYDLFRQYFFGEWNAPDGSFIIDDSENFFGMQQHIYYFKEFYQLNETVLAFSMGSNAEGLIFWLETDEPDIMYMMGLEWSGWLLVDDPSFEYTIVKTDASANDPTSGFLSIFKLREMARDHGIDFDLLTNIDYGFIDGKHFHHTVTYDFYPVYIVSEADDKIVLRTSIGNIGYTDLKPIEVICTFEKTDGEWTRTLDFANTSTLQ